MSRNLFKQPFLTGSGRNIEIMNSGIIIPFAILIYLDIQKVGESNKFQLIRWNFENVN